jgi:retinol-binding protein 3
VTAYQVEGYPVLVALPYGRPVNPVTGGNWEGTGVAPDVAAPAAEALSVAHSRALAAIAKKASDPEVKAAAELVRQIVDGRRNPVMLPAKDLAAFVGTYGAYAPRHVTLEDGILYYQRGPEPKLRLLPLGNDRFLVGDLDDRLMRFERDPSGKVVRVVGVFTHGPEEPTERSSE